MTLEQLKKLETKSLKGLKENVSGPCDECICAILATPADAPLQASATVLISGVRVGPDGTSAQGAVYKGVPQASESDIKGARAVSPMMP
ncbi:hypothetical protein RR48_01442 [Papilio machaon]|uniref:Uncharacterized protein n=1 Tax=Papilio machaon TaxID=76193 RepID=A0A0N0PDN3_PAPMA|nr:hypothetical protein RR48_01442 [Papilio machaon]